ncbi:contactin-5-like isoform X2 [Oscarella lobularis]|uniref:contactin-5-like isoform X2 n=1 Tax=Oscarella lobularis TaxID=121494 RepID=UPI003313BF22
MALTYCLLLLLLTLPKLQGFRVRVVANPGFVKERASFSLSCFVTGGQTSGASVTWRKDERPLIIDGKRITSFTNEFIYVIEAREDDTGWYECTVKKGSAIGSDRINVTVEGGATLQSVQSHVTSVVGANVSLECKARDVRAVRWLYNLAEIQKKMRFNLRTRPGRSALEISSVQMSDAGTYQCKNRLNAASILLTVILPEIPRIVVHPYNIEAFEGEKVTLVCEAIGRPPLTLSWVKITSEDHKDIRVDGPLMISVATRRHAGIYQCIARNGYGRAESKTATVSINPRENVPNLLVKQGESAVITCPFSDQRSTARWTKDDRSITLSPSAMPNFLGGSALLIANATCSDNGVYSCHVYLNETIDITCAMAVTVEGPPEPPTNLSVTVTCQDNQPGLLHATWQPSPCYSASSFKGYTVTVTAIDTISKAGKETATRAGPTSFQTSVLLDGSSCQDCSIVYGVELQADNEFGTSSLVRPTVVHSKSSGRSCSEESKENAILRSAPRFRIWVKDKQCQCSKSSVIFNITERVKTVLRNYIFKALRRLHQNTILSLTSETVKRNRHVVQNF